MSNKKKIKKISKKNEKTEKYLFYGIISGLVIGVIMAFILLIITDNVLWMTLPVITLFLGLGISSIIVNKGSSKAKNPVNKSK